MPKVPPLTIERLTQGILFILLFAMAIRVPLDTDTWWHLRSGEYFWAEGRILQTDIFSFTQDGREWVNHSWGGQAILWGFYRLTGGGGETGDRGAIGLALYTALLATGGMLLVYRMCVGNTYAKAFILVMGAATAAVFWSPRPQMLSFFFGALVLYLLHLYKWEGQKRALWALPPLMALWVNLHAGFAIGFIYLLGFMAGEAAGNIFNPQDRGRVGWRDLRTVLGISVLSLLALSLNPYGPRMMLYPFETAGLQSLNLFISEWLSPNFKNPQTWPFLVMLFAILALAGASSRRMDWTDLSLVGGTALLSFFAGRNIAVFALAAAPALARLLEQFLQERGWILQPMTRINRRQFLLNSGLLALIIFGALAKIAADLSPRNVERLQNKYLPLEAIAYLEANPPQGPLLNNYNWGGLLIFLTPEIPVFVDGRTDLYGDAFLGDYFRAQLGASDWEDLLAEYNIQVVLMADESAISSLLRASPAWRVVYEDEQALIFERDTLQTEGP